MPAANRRHPIDTCLAALEMQATVARMKALREKMRLPVLVLWRGRRAFIRANHSDSGAVCAVEREIDYHNIQKLDQLLP